MICTDRLTISRLGFDDCQFILELLNEPAFHEYIGDRGVRNTQDAREYLKNGPIGSYEKHGFGLFLVSLNADKTAIGICGLVKRDEFELPDLGFAFLECHWGHGYAHESSLAVLNHATSQLDLQQVIAIVDEDNTKSIQLLEKLGFGFEKMVRMTDETDDICQYRKEL